MNRIDKPIAMRMAQGNLPTAYDGWDRADCEIAGTIATRPFDYTKRGGIVIFEKGEEMLRIRKLTDGECMRLMGFEEKDTEACREAGLSKANIYHQSGDSICVNVLMCLFGELIGDEYKEKVEKYMDKLHSEVEE